MKRVGDLWDKFCSIKTATSAIAYGTQNKRQDYIVRRKFGYMDDLPEHVGALDPAKVKKQAQRIVQTIEEGWHPSPMRHKTLAPPGGKRREIDCPTLNDHFVHWMLILTVKDIIMRGMYKHTYGSLPGRGIDGARRTIERWVQHDTKSKYFVKLDLKKYYSSIDHDLLKAEYRRIIKDPRMLEVIDRIIDMIPSGVPIGAYCSQWNGNFFLQTFDHYVVQNLYKTRRGKRISYIRHYLRYMDDMLLMGSSKRDLEKAVREIIRYCDAELHLQIKPTWEIKQIADRKFDASGKRINLPGVAPIDICGYRFYREYTEVRSSIFLHASRLARKTAKRMAEKGYVLLHDAQSLVSLCGWFVHADSEYFLSHYINDKVSINFLEEVISYASKNGIVGDAARIYVGEREGFRNPHILYGCSGGETRRRNRIQRYCVDYELPLDILVADED